LDFRDRSGKGIGLERLDNVDGIVVPGGFWFRAGWKAKSWRRICREHGVPYLCLCMGMQVMVIEYGRSVLDLTTRTPQNSTSSLRTRSLT
jgi:CTP synthase